jgi:hypothetical protein
MTGRGQREGVAAEFLRDVLAGGALGVTELEVMARAAKTARRRPAHHPCEGVQKSQKVPWHKIRSERIWGRR